MDVSRECQFSHSWVAKVGFKNCSNCLTCSILPGWPRKVVCGELGKFGDSGSQGEWREWADSRKRVGKASKKGTSDSDTTSARIEFLFSHQPI